MCCVIYMGVDPLVTVHLIAGVALVALCLVVGAWGLARAGRMDAPDTARESRVFAHALQLSHTLVFAVLLLGAALLAGGRHAGDPLHARVYGPFMLVAVVAAYGYRTPRPATNVRIFAGAAIVIALLGLRAIWTG